jgi:hypothetical protein
MADDLIVDLTNYKDRVGSRVIPGRYTVVVDDAESDTARSGNPMVNLWLRVQGGDFDGATIVDRLVMTEKSLFRVVGFMQAVGLPTPRKRLKINVRAFVGRTLDIDVVDGEPYNGRVKSEVSGYMRNTTAAETTDDSPDLEDLADDTEVMTSAGSATEPADEASTTSDKLADTSDDDDDESVDIESVDLDEIDV